MDRGDESAPLAAADGIAVRDDRSLRVAALRYFDAAAFSSCIEDTLGARLPAALRACEFSCEPTGGTGILAWRSPTECLLFSPDPDPIDALRSRLTEAPDACVIEQTSGVTVLKIRGARAADLLLRLGAQSSVPEIGQALTGRLAEVTVMALRVEEPEVLLAVDTVYAEHLIAWIRATVADF
jgi:sarcosine oxidase gamma subunit